MNSISFGNFEVGIVPDPTNERGGGFEFASGMDIFSEPGVIKAASRLVPVSFGTGAAPTALPIGMVDTTNDTVTVGFIAQNDKILVSTDFGATWDVFITNGNGAILGLGIFNGYVWYASATELGRVKIDGTSQNDSFHAIDSDTEFHPMLAQAGTLKVGAGRYCVAVDELDNVTTQALKLPVGYRIKTMVEHLGALFIGTKFGAMPEAITYSDATVFEWDGIVLSAGSAFPNNIYPLKLLGMNGLVSDSGALTGFPGSEGDVYTYNGVAFVPARKLPKQITDFKLVVHPGAATPFEGSLLFGGEQTQNAGVFQIKNGAITQSFVPSALDSPGAGGIIHIGFIKESFNRQVIVGYLKTSDSSYHIDITDGNAQTGAFFKTLWHKMHVSRTVATTSNLKIWRGVKLSLKPLASGCSVAVAYRTTRDAAFTDSGYTVTSANQDQPVMFAAQPRAKEIQFRFIFTTSGANSPEMSAYEPLFDLTNSPR